MQFEFDYRQPIIHEGWMTKANIGLLERWQKRFFRLQGRCLFYFKKDNDETECGHIPLIDIELTELPAKKGRQFGFSIKIIKNPQIAKRSEYLINAEDEAGRKKWIDLINANRATSIVGQPLATACSMTPTLPETHLLLPYFVPPIFQMLNTTGFKLRGIWTIDIHPDIVMRTMGYFDRNLYLPEDDAHSAVAAILQYLKLLPTGLLPSSAMKDFVDKVTVEQLRALVLECNAPTRCFLRIYGLHLKKVLDASAQNGVTQYSLLPFLGRFLIRSPSNSSIPPAQVRSIQDQVATVFLQNTTRILEDVNQLMEAPRQNVIRQARIIQTVTNKGEDILEASRGLLVRIVREDDSGWLTVCTLNRRAGLIHNTWVKDITPEEEAEMKSGPNIDAMLDTIRERMPEIVLLFDSMLDESLKLRDALDAVSR